MKRKPARPVATVNSLPLVWKDTGERVKATDLVPQKKFFYELSKKTELCYMLVVEKDGETP